MCLFCTHASNVESIAKECRMICLPRKKINSLESTVLTEKVIIKRDQHLKKLFIFVVNTSIITSVLIPTVFCFHKKFAKVKVNEIEMCSLVAACTQHDINCENLFDCFLSTNLIFVNGDKHCSVLERQAVRTNKSSL